MKGDYERIDKQELERTQEMIRRKIQKLKEGEKKEV